MQTVDLKGLLAGIGNLRSQGVIVDDHSLIGRPNRVHGDYLGENQGDFEGAYTVNDLHRFLEGLVDSGLGGIAIESNDGGNPGVAARIYATKCGSLVLSLEHRA